MFGGGSGKETALQEDGTGTGRGAKGELVEGDDFAAGLEDAGAGGSGGAETADGQLRADQHTGIVGDSADEDGDLVILATHVTGQLGESQRRAVGL